MRAALTLSACLLLSACSLFSPRPTPIRKGTAQTASPAPAQPADGATSAAETASPAEREQAAAIASSAVALIGTTYHFGGADGGGFDCSGLALYVHERVGLHIPRTAAEQQLAARPVPIAQILPGDLVFFRIRKRGIDHVGIYTGQGRFVHAPHAGVAVASAALSGGYYARHIVSAGRFWEPAMPAR